MQRRKYDKAIAWCNGASYGAALVGLMICFDELLGWPDAALWVALAALLACGAFFCWLEEVRP